MLKDSHKLAYTIKEFMALAGVGHSFTYEEIASGRLRAVKAGRKTLIREDDARAWLAALPSVKSKSKLAFNLNHNSVTGQSDNSNAGTFQSNRTDLPQPSS